MDMSIAKISLFTRPAFRDSANAVLTSVVIHPNLTLRAHDNGARSHRQGWAAPWWLHDI